MTAAPVPTPAPAPANATAPAPAPRLEFGIIIGDVPDTISPREHMDRIVRQVTAAQESGFTYICIGQHFLYRSFRWPQPIPLLAHLAAITEPHVKLVASVLIVPFYHPVVLAEELATLDMVSGGRLIVGVGAGYRQEEFDLLQVPYAERFARLEEAVELIKLAWSQPSFSFEGRFWQLRDATTHVRPVQEPRPPIWFGAMGPTGIRRSARLGDGWMITVETSWADAEASLEAFAAERTRLGLPHVAVPIRREIVVGRDAEHALAIYEERALDRFLAYADRGADFVAADRDAFSEEFREWARARAVIGSAQECVERLRALDPARIGPIIIRPSWPGMTPDEVDASIREVGATVVRALERPPARTHADVE
jgi:alkanesulfonate monooxygenase SsuD/methylene tetrahydromethanopterin reductase-like flavin-dependent oxidoreductase (luciferase family)